MTRWSLRIVVIAAVVLVGSVIGSLAAVADEVRDFPTSEPGVSVSYLYTGPEYPYACNAVIGGGLPNLGLSFQLFSNGVARIIVGTEYALPKIDANGEATLKINSVYLFAKVVSLTKAGRISYVTLAPIGDQIKSALQGIREIATKPSLVSVMADEAQLPSATLPREPELSTALKACFDYAAQH